MSARTRMSPWISRSRVDRGLTPARRGARIRGQWRRDTRDINAPRNNAVSGPAMALIIRKSEFQRPCRRRSSFMPIVRPPSSEDSADPVLRFRSLTAVLFSAGRIPPATRRCPDPRALSPLSNRRPEMSYRLSQKISLLFLQDVLRRVARCTK